MNALSAVGKVLDQNSEKLHESKSPLRKFCIQNSLQPAKFQCRIEGWRTYGEKNVLHVANVILLQEHVQILNVHIRSTVKRHKVSGLKVGS